MAANLDSGLRRNDGWLVSESLFNRVRVYVVFRMIA